MAETICRDKSVIFTAIKKVDNVGETLLDYCYEIYVLDNYFKYADTLNI